MRLSEAAAVAHGALRGRDALFEGVAIDSREIRRGDLFVAIRGAQHDGHEFVARAGEQGAVGALVSERNAGRGRDSIAEIGVRDTTEAIGRLGAHWRSRFALPVVAVTGSNGKTTVTALIAAIFNRAGNCLSPRASFNNHWGVPLTLLRLRESHTHAVIEMGMNHRGEIAYLSGLTKPTIALINNVAPAHLAGLDNLQGIADAKAEIFADLAPKGVAVLNAHDTFYDYWNYVLQRLGVKQVMRFGVHAGDAQGALDVRAASLPDGRLELGITGQRAVVDFALVGKHNIANAAAAAAAAHAAGVGIEQICEGLNAFPGALPGRLATFRGRGGALVIDDSYNANPVSVQAALDVLAERGGARIAVLGAMAELGAQSAELHEQVGKHARRSGVRHLLCLGAVDDENITGYLRGFGEEGERYDNLKHLLARLVPLLENPAPDANAANANDETTVLIKGSRAAAMERVVARLRASDIPPDGDPPC